MTWVPKGPKVPSLACAISPPCQSRKARTSRRFVAFLDLDWDEGHVFLGTCDLYPR